MIFSISFFSIIYYYFTELKITWLGVPKLLYSGKYKES